MVSCGWVLTPHLSTARVFVFVFFLLCVCTHTLSQMYEILCKSCKCKRCKMQKHLESDIFCLFVFCFHDEATWLCDCDFSVCSLSCLLPISSQSRCSQNRLGHQWLSILWLKEWASCCTCYARDVMFLSPWFAQQSIYWRRFKVHYHLVLPRKTVEQHSIIEVNTGVLQKKRWAQILHLSLCLHLCLATKVYRL